MEVLWEANIDVKEPKYLKNHGIEDCRHFAVRSPELIVPFVDQSEADVHSNHQSRQKTEDPVDGHCEASVLAAQGNRTKNCQDDLSKEKHCEQNGQPSHDICEPFPAVAAALLL